MDPKIIQIETWGSCNGACSYCPVGALSVFPRPKMPVEIFQKSVDFLRKSKSNIVWLHHSGEPFLDSDLPGRIEYIKRTTDKKVAISTNMLAFTSTSLKAVFEANLDRMELHLTGFLSRLTSVAMVNAIHSLFRVKYSANYGISIGLNYSLREDETEQSVLEEWARLDILPAIREFHVVFYRPHSWTEMVTGEPTFKNKQLCDFIKHNGVSILSDGSIVRCCLDSW